MFVGPKEGNNIIYKHNDSLQQFLPFNPPLTTVISNSAHLVLEESSWLEQSYDFYPSSNSHLNSNTPTTSTINDTLPDSFAQPFYQNASSSSASFLTNSQNLTNFHNNCSFSTQSPTSSVSHFEHFAINNIST